MQIKLVFLFVFTQEMVYKIELHTNIYAYINITQYTSKKYTNLDGSSKETMSYEIWTVFRLCRAQKHLRENLLFFLSISTPLILMSGYVAI